MRYLYIMMLAAASALAADDPGGWSKAKWGMTDDELLKAFAGQVTRFDKIDPYQKARVGIESLEVAGTPFKVYLAPGSDDRLDHVLFTPIADRDTTDATFQSLENLLVQQYGRPWKSDEHGTTELQWTFQTTLISLRRSVLPRVPGMPRTLIVALSYRKRPQNPL